MSRQQKWASVAFDAITSVKKQAAGKDVDKDEYRTHSLKFPSLLIQSGLAQAVAFIESRNPAGKQFIKDLTKAIDLKLDLKDRALKASLDEYTQLSAQALGAAAWFRRFASELKSDEGGD